MGVLRTIFFQFGNWCVKRKYMIGGNNATKLFWFKKIISLLCSKDPCILVLRGHTSWINSVAKLNDNTICSGSDDRTVCVWSLVSNSCVTILKGHTDSVVTVAKLNENMI